jgi:predicted N-formylglutamate amidohydrolase
LRRNGPKLIFTCEHATPAVPPDLKEKFHAHRRLLRTHQGYDIGALQTARAFSASLNSPLISSTASRLVVDTNRSTGHARIFSEITRLIDDDQKIRILNRYYFPYRTRVESTIRRFIQNGQRVIHISVHTFTPVFDGKIRKTDIGLLFDPRRKSEREFCTRWRKDLRKTCPGASIHFNRPYRGNTDGLTSALRERWEENEYLGIELEINQRFILTKNRQECRRIHGNLLRTLQQALRESAGS